LNEVSPDAVAQAILDDASMNMGIWDLVCTSDPRELRKVQHGRGFIAIDAYPQIEKATKVFGPMGMGFGLTDVKYELIPDMDTSTMKKPGQRGPMMIMTSLFWYRFPGTEKMGQYPIVNDMVYEARQDVPKKLLTNAISKALSYLGFNYDVFKGSWDDNPYADRPEIPCPQFKIDNLMTLLRHGVENEVYPKKQAKGVHRFQVNAGWTLQSVENSLGQIDELYKKAGKAKPQLLVEGESTDGIPEDEAPIHSKEEKDDKGIEEA